MPESPDESTGIPEIVRCLNCSAPVTAKYCAACGQRHELEVHSLWHFAREATENITHADSRLWATLGRLLFQPGQLTRDFFDGRRARYLPPFRLYLVISLIFFSLASIGSKPDNAIIFDARADTAKDSTKCSGLQYSGPGEAWLLPRLIPLCQKVAIDGGKRLSKEFVHNVPRAMFIFLPLLAAMMRLFYWRPRRYYVEHLLFLVHIHAFVFLAIALFEALALFAWQLPANVLKFALIFYIPWYFFRALRVVYTQSRALTSVKYFALGVCYFFLATLMLLVTGLSSALLL